MAHLLFRLRHVTDEEALEVRQLLDEQGFDVYETQAGFFAWVSMPFGCVTLLSARPLKRHWRRIRKSVKQKHGESTKKRLPVAVHQRYGGAFLPTPCKSYW